MRFSNLRSAIAFCARVASTFIGIAPLVACGGGAASPTGPAVVPTTTLSSITLKIASATIRVGDSTSIIATGVMSNGESVTISKPVWSTETIGIVAVDDNGIVRGLAAGQTTIMAELAGKAGTVVVTVTPPPVARIELSDSSLTLVPTSHVTLHATLLDRMGRAITWRPLEWSTSDSSRATISQAGVVAAVAQGSATISATSEGISATVQVTVTAANAGVATIVISPGSSTLKLGETLQLTATAYDGTGAVVSDANISWTASVVRGQPVVTISPQGMVTAILAGEAKVEANVGRVSASIDITVLDNIDEKILVSFAEPQDSATVGDTLTIVVGVNSPKKVQSVTAKFDSKEFPLALTRVGALGLSYAWVLTVDITDVHYGQIEILVKATDETGAYGIGRRTFVRGARTGVGGSGTPPRNK